MREKIMAEMADFRRRLGANGIETDLNRITESQILDGIDIFFEALAGDYLFLTKARIARVLSGFKIDPQRLLEHYERALEAQAAQEEKADCYAWAAAEALCRIANETTYDRIAELLHDRSHGDSRQMLPYALARVKSRRDETVGALREHLDDEDILLQVLDCLGKLKAVEAIDQIRLLLEHPRKPVQSEAKKALLKIEKDPKRFQRVKALRKAPSGDLAEASSSLDMHELEPLLLGLIEAGLLGISPGVGRELAAFVSVMKLDQEEYFEVDDRGDVPTSMFVFIDDVDTCDVAFLGAEATIRAIEGHLDALED